MSDKKKKELTFESALRELEEIATALERETDDLDKSVRQFERGLELIRYLKGRLAKTDLTIKELKTKYRDVFADES